MKFLKPKSEFSRNVLTLMTGTMIAQAIPIAISPILTRIYTPEDFGVFALYISISTLLSVIATGKYEFAIMLPKKESDAYHIFTLSLIIISVISIFLWIIIFFFNDLLVVLFGNVSIGPWLYLIPLSVLLSGLNQSLNYWNNRNNRYKKIAYSKIAQSTASSAVNIGAGIQQWYGGLVFGSLAGQMVSLLTLMRSLWKDVQKNIFTLQSLKIYALAKKHKAFPTVYMAHSAMDVGKDVLVNILLMRLYDSFLLGQFYMVNKILLLPSTLVGSSLSQVFFREVSKKHNLKKDFSRDVLIMVKKLFLLSVGPCIIIALFSNELFVFVFGENWKVAGDLAASFSLYIMFQFVASPLSIVPLIVNQQLKAFYISLVGKGVYISAIIAGYAIFESFADALLMVSLLMPIYFLYYIRWIHRISKADDKAKKVHT